MNGTYRSGKRSLTLLADPVVDQVTEALRKGDSDMFRLTCLPAPLP